MKRLISSLSAVMLSVATVLTIAVPKAHAAATTLYWCGGTDTNFSTAANWNTNSDCSTGTQQAPAGGEALVFDTAKITAAQVGSGYQTTVNNDIASLSVDSVSFIDSSNSSSYGYIIAGSGISVASGLATSSIGEFDVPVTFTGNATVTLGGEISFGNSTTPQPVNLGSNNLTVSDNTSLSSSECTRGLVFNGPIAGTGSITDNSTYAVYLNADSPSYSGNIVGNKGLLRVNSKNALGDTTGTTTINAGSTLAIGITTDTTFAAENLTFGGTGSTSPELFADFPLTTPGCRGGAPNTVFTLTLPGSLTLAADATYAGSFNTKVSGTYTPNGHTVSIAQGATGTFTTSQGTVALQPTTTTVAASDKSTAAVQVYNMSTYIIDGQRGAVTVNTGGILKGTGTIGDLSVYTGGIVAPGHSPGCMSTGNLSLFGTYQAEIGGTTACSGYDQLKVTGTVTLSGTLDAILYNGYVPKVGEAYTIISNDGTDAVSGTFTGLAEGATYANQGVTYKITYKGGDGNDVVLTVTAVDASKLPKTPNTGFQLLTANPAVTASVATLAAATIILLQRRMTRATAKSGKSHRRR